MAFHTYITKRNSEAKVWQNPIKGNTYPDGIGFRTTKERDDYLNEFLEVEEGTWKDEVHKARTHTVQWLDETHFKITLDLMKDLHWLVPNQMPSRMDAISKDWLIMEDTNEPEGSKNKYTFWNIECNFAGDMNYSTMEFNCELDFPFTYPFDSWFKPNAGVNLDRASSHSMVQYGSEMAYQEDFNFPMAVFREVENIPLSNHKGSEYYNNMFMFYINTGSVKIGKVKDDNNKEYQAYFAPLYFEKYVGESKVAQTDLAVYRQNGGSVEPNDITAFMYQPARDDYGQPLFSKLVKNSQYKITMQMLPFNQNDFNDLKLEDTTNGLIVVPIDEATGSGNDYKGSTKTKDEVGGIYTATSPSQAIKVMLPPKLFQTIKETPRDKKIYSSQFSKWILGFGKSQLEIKLELTDSGDYDVKDFYYKIYKTPNSLTMDVHLPYEPYAYKNPFGLKGIPFDAQMQYPSVVNGQQNVLQNQNTINLTDTLNQRDASYERKDAIVHGITSVMSEIGKVGVGGLIGGRGIAGFDALSAAGNLGNQANESFNQYQRSRDKIRMQAAQLADSANNVGTFNDGNIDAMRAFQHRNTMGTDDDELTNVMQLTHYELVEPLKSMVENHLYQFGVNLGGDLYSIEQRFYTDDKFTFIKASSVENVYQALGEWLSPQRAKIMAMTLVNGYRIWWYNSNFTFVGDYRR